MIIHKANQFCALVFMARNKESFLVEHPACPEGCVCVCVCVCVLWNEELMESASRFHFHQDKSTWPWCDTHLIPNGTSKNTSYQLSAVTKRILWEMYWKSLEWQIQKHIKMWVLKKFQAWLWKERENIRTRNLPTQLNISLLMASPCWWNENGYHLSRKVHSHFECPISLSG